MDILFQEKKNRNQMALKMMKIGAFKLMLKMDRIRTDCVKGLMTSQMYMYLSCCKGFGGKYKKNMSLTK
jgi:hypothetical protein